MRFFYYTLLFFVATSFPMERETTCWDHLCKIVSWRNIRLGIATTFIGTGSALHVDANLRELAEPHSPLATKERALGIAVSFLGIPFLAGVEDAEVHGHTE